MNKADNLPMSAEEFLRDTCPNHTEQSKWNKSELLHILHNHANYLLSHQSMVLENLLEQNYELNVQYHKLMRESIYSFAVAIYDEKLTFEKWQEKHYGKVIEQPKNTLLSHHINVLAERIAEKAKTVCGYGDCDMTYCDMQCQAVDSNSIREIAKDYINELNLQSSK